MTPRFKDPVKPLPPKPSRYGPEPENIKIRASDLKGVVSVGVRDLFRRLPAEHIPICKGSEGG